LQSRVELVALGDTHFPWAHKRAIDFAIAYIKKHKPLYVVQLGDLLDAYCFSRYPTNPNVMPPAKELERGYNQAAEMWERIKDSSPDSACIQLAGNHWPARLNKRVAESLPAITGMLDQRIEALNTFPGVKSYHNDRDYARVRLPSGRKITLVHGWFTRANEHLRYFNESVIFGHIHRPHLIFDFQAGGKMMFELNAGWLGDPRAPVFKYGPTIRRKWQVGFGQVIDGYPSFVPYGY
jgi:predicted phosphodiesterase